VAIRAIAAHHHKKNPYQTRIDLAQLQELLDGDANSSSGAERVVCLVAGGVYYADHG